MPNATPPLSPSPFLWVCVADARDRGRGGARAVPRHVVRGHLGRHGRHHRQDEINCATHKTHPRAAHCTRPSEGTDTALV